MLGLLVLGDRRAYCRPHHRPCGKEGPSSQTLGAATLTRKYTHLSPFVPVAEGEKHHVAGPVLRPNWEPAWALLNPGTSRAWLKSSLLRFKVRQRDQEPVEIGSLHRAAPNIPHSARRQATPCLCADVENFPPSADCRVVCKGYIRSCARASFAFSGSVSVSRAPRKMLKVGD